MQALFTEILITQLRTHLNSLAPHGTTKKQPGAIARDRFEGMQAEQAGVGVA